MAETRRMLGDVLVEMGSVSRETLEKAFAQVKPNQRIGDYLVANGLVTQTEVTQALALQFQLPFLSLLDISFARDAVECIPEQVARRYQVIPVKIVGNTLTIAAADPLNVLVVDDLSFMTGLDIEMALMSKTDIERALERIYIRGEFSGAQRPEPAAPSGPVITAGTVAGGREEAPIVRLVDTMIRQAIQDQVSDIHIEPGRQYLRIRYRVDGVLHQVNELGLDVHSGLITRVKVMAGMDISERRLPLDGAIRYNHEGQTIDMRISTLPTVNGEKMVIRLLNQGGRLLTMDDIGLSQGQQTAFRSMVSRPYGLVIVSGPTGSGKTTTLQVMLRGIDADTKNVITIEDPVELETPGMTHVQVNSRIGLGFATVLRSVLRQDPDVVLVGETRDSETADIAVRSALTGHLVLTTLHTNDAPGAVTRLVDMDVEPFLVASSLVGVIAQRLVRRLCRHCARPVTYHPGSPEMIAVLPNQAEPLHAYEAVGCARCNQNGYSGRIGVFELLLITEELRELISRGATLGQLRQAAIAGGMVPLQTDGVAKVQAGITSLAEVMRVTFQE